MIKSLKIILYFLVLISMKMSHLSNKKSQKKERKLYVYHPYVPNPGKTNKERKATLPTTIMVKKVG